jgi:transcriptional regulator with XRE-family HTH domain
MSYRFDRDEYRRRRKAAGLRPEQIALAVGRTTGAVTNYELGRAIPPLRVLAQLCELLDCTPNDLLRSVDEAVPA